jgi:phage tail tape-measure protein
MGSAELQGTAEACQGFRETEMSNVGRVQLAALNFHVRNVISVATFDTNHFGTDIMQTVNRCRQVNQHS